MAGREGACKGMCGRAEGTGAARRSGVGLDIDFVFNRGLAKQGEIARGWLSWALLAALFLTRLQALHKSGASLPAGPNAAPQPRHCRSFEHPPRFTLLASLGAR